jgi:WXG100 family type VII secretion target
MPGAGNSMLRVERNELENTGMKITSAAKGIGEAIADAARRINALDGNWQGISNQNFMPEFNQSRTRAAAVSDGLTRLGSSLQEIGVTYESADKVPIEFDMNIEQDASGKVNMSYSFAETDNNGRGAHAYNQFDHNGDGSVSVDMQEVGVGADGQAQMSHVQLEQENFNMGGYKADDGQTQGSLNDDLSQNGDWAKKAEARGFPIDDGTGLSTTPDPLAPNGQQERLQNRVANAMGGLPGEQTTESLEERIAGMSTEADGLMAQVQNGESPTNAAETSVPRSSGGGGGAPMQISALPPLQQPQSTIAADLLESATPPEGYKEGDSLADKLMTAIAMDGLMDDSPLDRMGGSGAGSFTGNTPLGVGTMDLTDSMQTLSFPGQEVGGTAPDIDVDLTAENPLEGIPQDFFEEPREMDVKNVNPRNATKE